MSQLPNDFVIAITYKNGAGVIISLRRLESKFVIKNDPTSISRSVGQLLRSTLIAMEASSEVRDALARLMHSRYMYVYARVNERAIRRTLSVPVASVESREDTLPRKRSLQYILQQCRGFSRFFFLQSLHSYRLWAFRLVGR